MHPPDQLLVEPEIVLGFPNRSSPRNDKAAENLAKRTLTSLCNQRPRWLADAHVELDRAVAAAYGWPEDIATDDALARLAALNSERTAMA